MMRRILRIGLPMVVGVVLGILVVALFLAGEIYDYQDTVDGAHLPEVDAIVCLAGGRGRIAAAGDLWYRYWELSQAPPFRKPPVFYISGVGHQSRWGVLARQVRRGVFAVLRPSDVILEKESTNTEENAKWLSKFAEQYQWRRILLLTSSYHMRRARLIFERALTALGTPVQIETLSIYQEPYEPGEWRSDLHGIRITLSEYMKWIYYRTFWRA